MYTFAASTFVLSRPGCTVVGGVQAKYETHQLDGNIKSRSSPLSRNLSEHPDPVKGMKHQACPLLLPTVVHDPPTSWQPSELSVRVHPPGLAVQGSPVAAPRHSHGGGGGVGGGAIPASRSTWARSRK